MNLGSSNIVSAIPWVIRYLLGVPRAIDAEHSAGVPTIGGLDRHLVMAENPLQEHHSRWAHELSASDRRRGGAFQEGEACEDWAPPRLHDRSRRSFPLS